MENSTKEIFEGIVANNLRAAEEIIKNTHSIDLVTYEGFLRRSMEIKKEENLELAIIKSNALVYSVFEACTSSK